MNSKTPFKPWLVCTSGDLLMVYVAPGIRRAIYKDGHYVQGQNDPDCYKLRAEQVRQEVLNSGK